MLTRAHQDLVDPDDFCRACRGDGGSRERNERGGYTFERCYLCDGTGNRTVSVTNQKVAS